jgi:glycylpeptide N-tetradecanoyltransferase
VTRRVNLTGVYQAAYTAGIELPKPVSRARYWHRSLAPAKLVDIGFSAPPRAPMTMRQLAQRYRLSERPNMPFVPMVAADVPEVAAMLTGYLAGFELSPVMTEEDVAHWFVPRERVVYSFVLREAGKLVGFISFYELPSKILKHPVHKLLRAAYSFYSCAPEIPRLAILQDALILAKAHDFDVFNALNIQDNDTDMLSQLRFGIGDGNLHYYLYNYIYPELKPDKCGLVLM